MEGERLVLELREPWKLQTLVLSQTYYDHSSSKWSSLAENYPKANILVIPDSLMESLSDTQNPQGILAVVPMRTYQLSDMISEDKASLLLILENLQDPGNAGTILRTADAAGADGVICTVGTVDFFAPKTVRATMGSLLHLPIVYTNQLSTVLQELKDHGFRTYAAHLKGTCAHFEADMKGKTAILIGNEGNGLTDETAGQADQLVRIPQPGQAESLNASIAAGILIYEAVRQKLSEKKE